MRRPWTKRHPGRLTIIRPDGTPLRVLTVDDEPSYLHEYDHLTLVRVLLARHRAADLPAFLERLRAAASDRPGSLREIRLLQALAHHAHGDATRALAALSDALTAPPEPESYVRLFLDEGARMRALLRDATGDVAKQARRLLARSAAPEPVTPATADPLSSRELEVLRLLDTDLTGPEIARRLYITVNTLRTHTKRIFTKLDVTTRAAAVRRAREHGLL